jgi:hypothetical protein
VTLPVRRWTCVGWLLAAGLLGPLPALAQQAGVYAGTTADGTQFQVTVATDAGTGQLYVDSVCASAFTSPTCRALGKQGYSACAGPGSAIAGGVATLLTKTQQTFVSATLHFTRRKAFGHVTFETPILTSTTPTLTVDLCGVTHQSFTAAGP